MKTMGTTINKVLWLLVLLFATACDKNPLEQQLMGTLVIGNLSIDYSFTTEGATRSITRDPNAPAESDFTIEVVDSYGTVIKSGKPKDFADHLLLFETTYTVRAFYGNAETEISNLPYYYGETSVKVKANETTFTAPITATLQYAMVNADISDISSHFTSTPKVYVTSSSSKVELASASWIYLKPNQNYTLSLEGTNQAGIAVSPTLKTWTPVERTAYAINVTPDLPIITLPDQQAGAWAKRLYIIPATATNVSESAKATIIYEVSNDNWNTIKTATDDGNGNLLVTGLNPNSLYNVRARIGIVSSNEITITTENANGTVPNAQFEEWTEKSKTFKGIGYNVTRQYFEPYVDNQYWFTNNEETVKNPGTVGYPAMKCFPTVDRVTGRNNGYAAQIRCVAVNSANSLISASGKTVGKMYITDYILSSRPSSLSLYYQYYIHSNDVFKINVTIKDTTGSVLATGSTPTDNYNSNIESFTLLNIPLSYTSYFKPTANGSSSYGSISIEILSSNSNSGSYERENTTIGGNGDYQIWGGSRLIIDDIELIYD